MNRLGVWCLFALCALDTAVTDIGLRLHLIEESNGLIQVVYGIGPLAYYTVKLGLPLALVLLAPKIKPRWLTRNLLKASLTAYLGVMFVHSWWIAETLSARL